MCGGNRAHAAVFGAAANVCRAGPLFDQEVWPPMLCYGDLLRARSLTSYLTESLTDHRYTFAGFRRISPLNSPHTADHQRKGRTDRPARDKFLRTQARQLAEKTPDGTNGVSADEWQEMHYKELVEKHGQYTMISALLTHLHR